MKNTEVVIGHRSAVVAHKVTLDYSIIVSAFAKGAGDVSIDDIDFKTIVRLTNHSSYVFTAETGMAEV